MTLYRELRARILYAEIKNTVISESDAREIIAHFSLTGKIYLEIKEYTAKYYNHPAVGISGRAALDALERYIKVNGVPA